MIRMLKNIGAFIASVFITILIVGLLIAAAMLGPLLALIGTGVLVTAFVIGIVYHSLTNPITKLDP